MADKNPNTKLFPKHQTHTTPRPDHGPDDNLGEQNRENAVEVMPEAPPAPIVPNRVYSKNIDYPQDEFKLEITKMTRDRSFLPSSVPDLQYIEHCHFFYTTDRKGTKMTMCTATGGHKHEVKTSMDAEGNLLGVCGPPIPHNGTVFIGPKNSKGVQVESPKYKRDTHTHPVNYQKSAVVSKNRAKMKAQEIVNHANAEAEKAALA